MGSRGFKKLYFAIAKRRRGKPLIDIFSLKVRGNQEKLAKEIMDLTYPARRTYRLLVVSR